MPAIVQLSLLAFVLLGWAVFTAASARFFLRVPSATIELGFGPEVFVLHLNQFTYRIRLVPLFVGQIAVRAGRLQWVLLVLPTLGGLLLLALLAFGAGAA